MKVLLLSADTYSLTNEQTGEIIDGCTLFYLNRYREDGKSALGFKPTKISAPLGLFSTLQKSEIQLPAMAEIDITTRPGAQGKASLICLGVTLIEAAEIF